VLCEKPFASNAADAEAMLNAANASGKVLMEAFHWRFHPLAARMAAIVASGELGTIRRIETAPKLAGGVLMDIGTGAHRRCLPVIRLRSSPLSSARAARVLRGELSPGARCGDNGQR
jgi:hypothetical protein